MEIEIKPAENHDAKLAAAALLNQVFPTNAPTNLEHVTGSQTLTAHTPNGQVVGVIAISQKSYNTLTSTKVIPVVTSLAVHPNFRRRNIGRKLINAAIEHLKQEGHSEFYFEADDAILPIYRKAAAQAKLKLNWKLIRLHSAKPLYSVKL